MTFSHVLICCVVAQYEYHMVLELLTHGHPEPSKKVSELPSNTRCLIHEIIPLVLVRTFLMM